MTWPNLRFKLPSTGPMVSADREPIMGVWGRAPSRFHGQSPGQGAKPPGAVSFSAFQHLMTVAKFTQLTVSGKLSVCDVSTTLNRIPNTCLLRTG